MSDQPTETIAAQPEKPKSKYTLVEMPEGVLIQREGGLELHVHYADTYIHAGEKVGLYCFKQMVEAAAMWFAEQLVGRKRQRDIDEAKDMIARALKGRLWPHWRRIVEQIVPPHIAKLARLMWDSTQNDAWVLHQPELYADAYQNLRRDLEKHHACRMFARAVESSSGTPTTPETRSAWFGKLANWREELSPTVPNKALNKTLDKLPTGISFHQITRLAVMRLEKPLTGRLPVIFALCAAGHHNFGLHERIVLNADATAIQQAAQVVNQTITARSRTGHIQRVASLILDYPERYGGDLVGLARRSQEWHAEIDYYDEVGLPPDYLLPVPEVELAALELVGITLLKTAGEVHQEGKRMRHCVGSYATKAAAGGCYLFHVEHDDSCATVEVLPGGYVSQAYGPGNSRNAACTFGVRELSKAFKVEETV